MGITKAIAVALLASLALHAHAQTRPAHKSHPQPPPLTITQPTLSKTPNRFCKSSNTPRPKKSCKLIVHEAS